MGLVMEGLNFLVLVIVGGGEEMVSCILEVTLIVDVTSKVTKDPLDNTRVREQGEPHSKDRALVTNNIVQSQPHTCI